MKIRNSAYRVNRFVLLARTLRNLVENVYLKGKHQKHRKRRPMPRRPRVTGRAGFVAYHSHLLDTFWDPADFHVHVEQMQMMNFKMYHNVFYK